MNLYRVIKDNIDDLIKDLKKHKNEVGYYYEIRELDRNAEIYNRLTPVEKASRLFI